MCCFFQVFQRKLLMEVFSPLRQHLCNSESSDGLVSLYSSLYEGLGLFPL